MAENEQFLRSILETVIYGIAKSDKILSGNVATFFRTAVIEAGMEFARRYKERLHNQESIGDVVENFIKIMEEENIFLPGSMKIIEKKEDEVTIEMHTCSLGDLCKRFEKEDLKDPRGFVPCFRALELIGVINIIRDEVIDWEFIKFDPPKCIFKLKKL